MKPRRSRYKVGVDGSLTSKDTEEDQFHERNTRTSVPEETV
jgi:hypothetical protein